MVARGSRHGLIHHIRGSGQQDPLPLDTQNVPRRRLRTETGVGHALSPRKDAFPQEPLGGSLPGFSCACAAPPTSPSSARNFRTPLRYGSCARALARVLGTRRWVQGWKVAAARGRRAGRGCCSTRWESKGWRV